MKVYVLHAIAALLALVLFIIRRKKVNAVVCYSASVRTTKKRELEPLCSDILTMHFPSDRIGSTRRRMCCQRPRYKRDPDLSVDNEDIGQHPHVSL